MRLVKEGATYIAVSSFEERAIPKDAGFRWDPAKRRWWTDKVAIAAKLAQYAEDGCRAELEAIGQARTATVAASRARDAHIEIPVPEGLEYMPFQRAGIVYASSRPATLIADEMGLGKTIQALGVINAKPEIRTVLVICPASLRLNWEREAKRWLIRPFVYDVIDSPGPVFEAATFVICNYDRLSNSTLESLMARRFDCLIVDESHYVKNPKAQRTQRVLGGYDKKTRTRIDGLIHRADVRLFLTGTPILNRPIELHPLAAALNPSEFGNMMAYAKRYCAAYEGRWGWDFTGASHLDELQEKLRASIMVRRLKKDVLTELPPKTRQVVILPANGAAGAVEHEAQAWSYHEARLQELQDVADLAHAAGDTTSYEEAVACLRDEAQAAFAEISKLRHETAMAKLPAVIAHIEDALEQEEKLVVFAHHHDVVHGIAGHFPNQAVWLTGELTDMAKRQDAVDRFQNDPTVKLFVGSIMAAGVGLTLTAASHVIFAELDWVPGNITQAEDRLHRIGQRGNVLVQHIVLDESLDARMAQTLVAKQAVLDAALDDMPIAKSEPAIPTRTDRPTRPEKYPVATNDERARVSLALRTLAGMCDGAVAKDGAGFNQGDARIGHELAGIPLEALTDGQVWLGSKIIRKYHRQIGGEYCA